jgi:hypothetical protein
MYLRRAFVLIPILAVISLCVLIALLCLSECSLGSISARTWSLQARLHLSALAASRLGLGALQQHLGPDQRLSGSARNVDGWAAELVGEDWIKHPLADRMTSADGVRLNWEIADLSCRCDLGAPILALSRSTQSSRRARMRQVLASGASQAAPELTKLSAAKVADLDYLYKSNGCVSGESIYTAGTRSLLLNPLSGQWRENLSVIDNLAKRYGTLLAARLLSPPLDLSNQPQRGLEPIEVGERMPRFRHMPVLTDFRISLGVFNARSDGRHRVRLHSHFTFWNPSALALLTPADKRLFLAEVEGAPEITVHNLDSGAIVTAWLDRNPQGVFWTYTQGPRETTIWWWVDVLDSTRHGMARSGILPGEVYSLLVPDPVAQPFGVARVIDRGTWRYDASEHSPGWKRPSADVFLPTDRIVISVRFITPGLTLRLRPYVGLLNAQTSAVNYPSPALYTLSHIPWPDARLELTGAEYSRVDSGGYVISERCFSWRARLRPKDQDEVLHWSLDSSFMQGDIDLAQPKQAAKWDITQDPVAEAQASRDTLVSPAEGIFWDAYINEHQALTAGAYADIRTRNLPIDPPVEWYTLSQLTQMPVEESLSTIDSTFFAYPVADVLDVKSENPRLVPWVQAKSLEEQSEQRERLYGPDAAQLMAIEGVFNVNTSNPLAWKAFLESDPVRWSADTGGPSLPGRIEANFATFSLPSGAMLGKYGSENKSDLSDEQLSLTHSDAYSEAIRRQSIRSITDAKLTCFCEALASRIEALQYPFIGVADFLGSKVIEEAIKDAALNEGIPEGSPMHLDGPRMLAAFLPFLVARGDTFKVRGEAETDGKKVVLELTLQRHPGGAAMPHLGRKFKVVAAHWR